MMRDICACRDDAQPHIFEAGRCVLCYKHDPEEPQVWYFNTRDGGYHLVEVAGNRSTVRVLSREQGRQVFREA